MRDLYVGLVHWPVLNSKGDSVATTITHFDIHDISRVCRTYGVKNYYLINRLEEQLMFASRVLGHWKAGAGSDLNQNRQNALAKTKAVATVEEALKDIGHAETFVVTTAAREIPGPESVSFKALKSEISKENKDLPPILLLFGTGSGLHDDVIQSSDALLEPIWGASEDKYRHLSVRSAVSICLDRLTASW